VFASPVGHPVSGDVGRSVNGHLLSMKLFESGVTPVHLVQKNRIRTEHRHTHTHCEHTHRERERERETHTHTEIERERERETHTHTQTERV